jgi:hypothetical protein
VTFVTTQDPTKRAAKQYSKKTTPNLTTTKITTTTTTATTTNNSTTITPNGTALDQNLEDYKSNHNNRCPKQQKVWSLDPSQANH